MRAIHADPRHTGGPATDKANAFDEKAGAFRASTHQIIRPFETRVGRAEIPRGARQRDARNKTELRCDCWRTGIDHQDAGVKVALWRDPGPPTPASSGGLLVGDDPQASRVARMSAAARLLVGGIDRAKSNDAPALLRALQRGGGQKSDCAAAIAALVIGEGANTNRMIISAETASTMRETAPGRSNAAAGSSKYISLTILK